ncbi:hypothetical protein Tco_0726514 [Tanacetum coccineum]|uniref:Uncharacterized protein n=1 Tax=Tanacetum coccineum TaxID=301880 RepID=A0ABQ4YFS4_9ASTR
MKRPRFDLQQESTQKNEKIESKQVEEEIVQQKDVVAEQVVIESSKKAGGKLKRTVSKARKDKDKRQNMQDNLENLHLQNMWKLFLIQKNEMLNDFDKEDLIVLYRLFNEKYASTRPSFNDLILWGDLKIIVHSLMLGEVTIHMLVEKKYPLLQDTLTRMLRWKLHVNNDVTKIAYELLRFIKSQLH